MVGGTVLGRMSGHIVVIGVVGGSCRTVGGNGRGVSSGGRVGWISRRSDMTMTRCRHSCMSVTVRGSDARVGVVSRDLIAVWIRMRIVASDRSVCWIVAMLVVVVRLGTVGCLGDSTGGKES